MPEPLFLKSYRPQPATLLKKRLWYKCFPAGFANVFRTPFSQNTSGWLLFYPKSFIHWSNVFLSRSLLLQGQQWKYQSILQNLLKFNNKASRATKWLRFDVFILNFEQILHNALMFSFNFEKYMSQEISGKSHWSLHNIFWLGRWHSSSAKEHLGKC